MKSDSLRSPFAILALGLVLGLALGLPGGWWMRDRQSRTAAAHGGDRLAQSSAPVGDTVAGERAHGLDEKGAPTANGEAFRMDPNDIQGSLQRLLKMKDPVELHAAVDAVLRDLPPEKWLEFYRTWGRLAEAQVTADDVGGFAALLGSAAHFFDGISKTHPEAFLKSALAAPEGSDADDAIEGVLRCWAERDLESALKWHTENLSQLEKMPGTTEGLAREMVKKDPERTMGWLGTLPSGLQVKAVSDAFQTLSHSAPTQAASLLISHPQLAGREAVARSMAQGWAATEPEKALVWAAALPPDLRDDAISGGIGPWAAKDPAAAQKFIETLPAGQQLRVIGSLISHSPPQAMPQQALLLAQLPPGESPPRTEATATLITQWMQHDATAASTWLGAQEPSASRDAGIRALAESIQHETPHDAAIWAADVSQGTVRRALLDQTLDDWAKKDSPSARQWVEAHPGLTPEERVRWRARLSE